MKNTGRILGLVVILGFLPVAHGATGARIYEKMGIEVEDVLSGTVLNARLFPGDEKQAVCVVTYLTGKRDEAEAVNVRLGVFRDTGEALETVYERDFGAERGGHVGYGDLQLIDLDRDGTSEMIVCYDSFEDPLIEQRMCEVMCRGEANFRTAWRGPVEYDATKAAREIPRERRDRYRREFDWANTLRTKGLTLFVDKQVIAVAGERLDEPKVVQETFPLRRLGED
jgi:hypothetical protein